MMNATEANILATKNKNAQIQIDKERLFDFVEKKIDTAVKSGCFSCRIQHDNKFEPLAIVACKSFLTNLGYDLVPLDRGFIIKWNKNDLHPD